MKPTYRLTEPNMTRATALLFMFVVLALLLAACSTANEPNNGGVLKPQSTDICNDPNAAFKAGVDCTLLESDAVSESNALFTSSLFTSSLSSSSAIVPGANATAEGNWNNAWPFNCGGAYGLSSQRYQQVYLASEVGSRTISEIRFRRDGGAPTFTATTLLNVTVTLSTTSKAIGALSTAFNNNVGSDVATVYSGNLTILSFSTSLPRAFDIVIPLEQVFPYNASLGNLLLDISVPNCGITAQIDTVQSTSIVSRAYTHGWSTYTDSAGLITQFVSPVTDTTPPDTTIGDAPTHPTNSNSNSFTFSGTDNVTAATDLTFECSLGSAAFSACTSPKTYNSLADGSHTFRVRAKDTAGNVDPSPASHTWVVDTTPPGISLSSRTPAANTHGWNNTDVELEWTCTDDGSGVVSETVSETVGTEGEDQSVTGTCTDGAGNAAPNTQSGISIDKTKPTASAVRSVAANAHGWNNVDVTVSFSGTDSLSDVDTCSASQSFSEGASQTATGTCTDKAGNTSDAVVETVNIDKALPSISATSSYTAGTWTNQNVVVNFNCTDTLSGVASVDGAATVSGEGANQSVSGTCTDKADNSSSATFSNINIDKTAPTVTVTGVSNGQTYTLGSVPAAGCSTSDALSGVVTEASLSVTGGNSNGVGSFTATCSGAADKAGNTGSASVSYNVVYNFTGFFNPINNSAVNVAKAGSGIPVKFSLSGNQGLGIMASGSPSSQKINCESSAVLDPVEETVNAGGSSLSYDAAANQYVYVWKTDKAWAGTCRQLTVTLNDGTSRSANFKFNK